MHPAGIIALVIKGFSGLGAMGIDGHECLASPV
jgi:hypothetical protein